MEAEFWIQTWKNGRLGFHQANYNPLMQKFWPEMSVKAGQTVFVPLCGKSKDMLWLRAQGHPVLGVEISPIAAEQFFVENDIAFEVKEMGAFQCFRGNDMTILCGDIFDVTADLMDGVAAVYDRASLVALPVEMRQQYAAHMAAMLKPPTKVLLLVFEYPQHEMSGPPFSVDGAEVKTLHVDHYALKSVWSKDITDRVGFAVSSFVQTVFILERQDKG